MYEKGEREYQIPEEFRKYGMLLAWAKTSRIKSLAVAVLKDETVRGIATLRHWRQVPPHF